MVYRKCCGGTELNKYRLRFWSKFRVLYSQKRTHFLRGHAEKNVSVCVQRNEPMQRCAVRCAKVHDLPLQVAQYSGKHVVAQGDDGTAEQTAQSG
jgi:hypothetical protein